MASYAKMIAAKVEAIRNEVGKDKALMAMSGGVDSSVVALLGHLALGKKLTVLMVENGLMREGEPKRVKAIFAPLGIRVRILDARAEFFAALEGKTDPEIKRQAITDTFYAQVFARYVREKGIKHVLQGTILTDIDETVAGIKRQHNVLAQVGIDPVREYGYNVIEPLIDLRKDGVRALARALKLPREIASRIPFPGPALAARVIGEVTPERVAKVRQATTIVEEELKSTRAFQYLAVLMSDQATGMKDYARHFGDIIVVRCIDSLDARKAKPTQLSWPKMNRLAKRLTAEVPGCVRVLYDLTPKPPATVEFI
ncbi:MAG: ATP-binding protein [Candidatus Lernaella stagnicola]|nr:ATP-binding protein [Candidatus Lernaella stagnicola]